MIISVLCLHDKIISSLTLLLLLLKLLLLSVSRCYSSPNCCFCLLNALWSSNVSLFYIEADASYISLIHLRYDTIQVFLFSLITISTHNSLYLAFCSRFRQLYLYILFIHMFYTFQFLYMYDKQLTARNTNKIYTKINNKLLNKDDWLWSTYSQKRFSYTDRYVDQSCFFLLIHLRQ